jgi:glutamine synthetase
VSYHGAVSIPTVLVSYKGAALDEMTPFPPANATLEKRLSRLLKHLGLDTYSGIQTKIGPEQGIFRVPREQYYRRPDLRLTGRTLIGRNAPRGQETCDHCMAPLSSATAALDYMQEIQGECWRLGIPLETLHRELAPNQFEFAPLYGNRTTQIDQNIIVMQNIEEVVAKHGLAALLQEKHFEDVNRAGKHNYWSIAIRDGINLLAPDELTDHCVARKRLSSRCL